MTPAGWGALLGALGGVGVVLVLTRVVAFRRADLSVRVLPFVRDLPTVGRGLPEPAAVGPVRAVFGPLVESAAGAVERVLGGSASVRRRIERARLPMTVHDFRVEQVLWGLAGLAAFGVPAVAISLRAPDCTLPLLVLCGVAFAAGVLLRENRLTAQVTFYERAVMAEFPTLVELLALAVGAGEGPVAAVDRVVSRSHGAMSAELRAVLADVRTGTGLAVALDRLAARTGLPAVARFAEAMAVAVDRGTPLTGVLHAQAVDAREAGRRALIESGARREVLMMVPVVFLILPVTVLFAFWPGVVGLHLVTP
ncbi:MAG: type II secretion system F family protein [Nocardioides sp.]